MSNWAGCRNCIHYQKNGKCRAFPNGIPIMFASGDIEHNQVIVGQVGDFVYEENESSESLKVNVVK